MIRFINRFPSVIGSTGADWENLSGFIASARLYDKALTQQEVVKLMTDTKPKK